MNQRRTVCSTAAAPFFLCLSLVEAAGYTGQRVRESVSQRRPEKVPKHLSCRASDGVGRNGLSGKASSM